MLQLPTSDKIRSHCNYIVYYNAQTQVHRIYELKVFPQLQCNTGIMKFIPKRRPRQEQNSLTYHLVHRYVLQLCRDMDVNTMPKEYGRLDQLVVILD